MDLEYFWSVFEGIGSTIGILITIITFVGMVTKKPIEALRKLIREESKHSNIEFENDVRKVLERADRCDKTMIVLLRHDITFIYEKYKDKEKFPVHVKEDVFSLIEQYESWHGNSYVSSLKKEME